MVPLTNPGEYKWGGCSAHLKTDSRSSENGFANCNTCIKDVMVDPKRSELCVGGMEGIHHQSKLPLDHLSSKRERLAIVERWYKFYLVDMDSGAWLGSSVRLVGLASCRACITIYCNVTHESWIFMRLIVIFECASRMLYDPSSLHFRLCTCIVACSV